MTPVSFKIKEYYTIGLIMIGLAMVWPVNVDLFLPFITWVSTLVTWGWVISWVANDRWERIREIANLSYDSE